MYESITVVGERGQITIPKLIRENKNIKPKEKLIVKIENNLIVLEKLLTKKKKEQLMTEGYKKLAMQNLKIENEWRYASTEADRLLDEY